MHYPHSQALGHLAHLYLWPPPLPLASSSHSVVSFFLFYFQWFL